MKSIKILDCTLRDGAQVNEARFGERPIKDIISNLTKAKTDIIECGFLKDVEYEDGRTYFPQPSYMQKYIPENKNESIYSALVDFGRYDIDALEPYSSKVVDLIRVSFFEKDIENVKPFCKAVLDKGYKLSMQPMDTFSYTEENVKKVIDIANEINTTALAMVDTYSLARIEDIDRVFSWYHESLKDSITIGFHSHNNQLNSFALAQHFMSIVEENRDIIIDASLLGMGRGGGNLNTELFSEYLNREGLKSYDMKPILDSIDQYLVKFKTQYKWGYSMPMLYAGLYGVHVHTVAYLENKPDMTSYDLKCIFQMLDEHKKKRYDYDYLDSVYEKYMNEKSEANHE